MGTAYSKKLLVLYILDILQKYTDEEHRLSQKEILEILRKDLTTAHIPVIALSANAMPRDIVRGLEVGFFRYLTKPIKLNEFLDTLDAALQFSETQSAGTNTGKKYDS